MRNLGIVGMPGKMATRVAALCTVASGLQLRVGLARASSASIGQDIGTLATGSPSGMPVLAFDPVRFADADVWLEFASASVTQATIAAALGARKPVLICTTGLDAPTTQAIHAAAQHVPVMLAPNTSLGVAALNAALRVALKALGPSYQAEVVELHHDKKKDAPSGTALRLVDTILGTRPTSQIVTGRRGARTPEEIGVFAVRGGNVIGEHTVYLFGENDRLELTHRAASRDLFATGAIRAAAWLAEQKPGFYTIENCLDLETE